MSNSITVFSNGVADFVTSYPVKKGEKREISIPVKKDHVGDVLASLNVFGDVRLDSPPSFSPSNDLTGDLQVDTADVLYDLSTKLSGAKVSVSLYATDKPIKGTLMGVHAQETVSEGVKATEYSLVVLCDDSKIYRYALDEVSSLSFVDETVQLEISKALQRNFRTVKPNSTFVDLVVIGEKDTEALVQYTVPAAAWKISYRLNKRSDKFSLKGVAIVDNNTEEDWKEVIVSVVTGEPITFSTDLAESKTPSRSHVNIVNDKAVGAVEVERGRGINRCAATTVSKHGRNVALAACSIPSVMPCMNINESYSSEVFSTSAMIAETEVKEVGDYSIFTSNTPLTIASNRSAVIPVFDSELSETKTVLHYDSSNNRTRPYICLDFKNETEHSLGRGVCAVYLDGMFSGSCILPAAKIGQNNLMPYALETGVKVLEVQEEPQVKLSSIKISGGIFIGQNVKVNNLNYSFDNGKSEKYEIYFDFKCPTSDDRKVVAKVGKETLEVTKVLSDGYRFKLMLDPNTVTDVKVVETISTLSNVTLTLNYFGWFISQYIENGPLKDLDVLDNILTLNSKINECTQKIEKAGEEVEKIEAKQKRLRENINVGANDENKNKWITELNKCEEKLSKIEDTDVPAHEAEKISLSKKFETALKELSFEWKA